MAVTLTDANFKQEILDFTGIALVDFYADWCGPCRVMAPHIAALAEEYAGTEGVKVGKLDVDANQETSLEQRVMSLPSFKLFVGGTQQEMLVGSVSPDKLKALLSQAVAARAAGAAGDEPQP